VQFNNEKAFRLRKMAQVLQDINNIHTQNDAEKVQRLDKEFKIHEDLLAIERENE